MKIAQKAMSSCVILALFSMLLFITYGEKGLVDLSCLTKKKDSLINKNLRQAKINISLSRKVYRLKNDFAYIEDVARQELGLIGMDELIFKIKKGNRGKNG